MSPIKSYVCIVITPPHTQRRFRCQRMGGNFFYFITRRHYGASCVWSSMKPLIIHSISYSLLGVGLAVLAVFNIMETKRADTFLTLGVERLDHLQEAEQSLSKARKRLKEVESEQIALKERFHAVESAPPRSLPTDRVRIVFLEKQANTLKEELQQSRQAQEEITQTAEGVAAQWAQREREWKEAYNRLAAIASEATAIAETTPPEIVYLPAPAAYLPSEITGRHIDENGDCLRGRYNSESWEADRLLDAARRARYGY